MTARAQFGLAGTGWRLAGIGCAATSCGPFVIFREGCVLTVYESGGDDEQRSVGDRMTLEELDRTARRLRSALEQIRDELVDIELDPSRALLDESNLGGHTATRWASASAMLSQLWEWHRVLDALLERFEKLRGARTRLRPRQIAELRELIERPSITCVNHRESARTQNVVLAPVALVDRMPADLGEAKAVLAQIDAAWDTFGPRLRAIGEVLAATRELCGQLAEPEPQDLAPARQGLAALSRTLARDPLSVRIEDVDALEASAAAPRADLEAIAGLRDHIGERMAGAHELLGELRRTVRDADTAYAEVVAKIAGPRVAAPVSVAESEAQFEEVVERAEADAWGQAWRALSEWTTRAELVLEEARRIAAESRASLAARDELRGRLVAYEAKAMRLGLIEDPEVLSHFESAQEALYTAPTDVEAAKALLLLYQQALLTERAAREAQS